MRPKPKVALTGTGTVIGPATGAVPAPGAGAGAGDVNNSDIGGDGDGDWFVDASRRRDATRDEVIEYGAGVCAGGKLALLTARMLRASYTCPECRGARFLKRPAERDMFLMRWPELDCTGVVDMPCPCCVGYDYAAEACDYNNSEDEWPSMGAQVQSIVSMIRKAL